MSEDALRAALRDLPADAWESWLVLADVLAEAGDERGALLVREHRGHDIAREAAAWIESWRAYVAETDVEVFTWIAQLHALAWRAPADLRPVFAQPLGQLLALIPIADDPPPRLSRVLALHRERLRAAVEAWIERAFDGVPVPDEDHRTIHQAEAADNYETCDRSRDHLGRWQDLPDAHLLANQWALSHLDAQGIHYYVPAVMRFALRHVDAPHTRDSWITESLEYTLQPSSPNLRGYQRDRFARFDHAQRAAIAAYTVAMTRPETSAAWLVVLEHERDGPKADWFDVYNP